MHAHTHAHTHKQKQRRIAYIKHYKKKASDKTTSFQLSKAYSARSVLLDHSVFNIVNQSSENVDGGNCLKFNRTLAGTDWVYAEIKNPHINTIQMHL